MYLCAPAPSFQASCSGPDFEPQEFRIPNPHSTIGSQHSSNMSRTFSLASPAFSRESSRSRTILPFSSTTFQEDAPDDIGSCENLLRTLIDADVPGPLLFRLRQEFDTLEEAGQSQILKAKDETVEQIQKIRKSKDLSWFIDSIVIKKHEPRASVSTQLGHHFLAARREVVALSRGLFQGHPNIVQLRAWGFCLDTIEEPQRESIQVPLLILERAESDLEQFLQNSDERSARKSHTLRVRLCRDIGAGLEILHRSGFTHGDLKPKNVLVFRGLSRWTAKLCDFGCAQQQASEPSTGTNRSGVAGVPRHGAATYLGTANWLPPEVATRAAKTFDHETLQRCDIFVYGMVVWSTLCKEGKPCTFNDLMDPMEAQNQAMQDIMALRMSSSLLSVTLKVLQACICYPNERSLTPWDNFHHDTLSSALSGIVKQVVNALSHQDLPPFARTMRRSSTALDFIKVKSPRIYPSRQPNVCRPLHPEEKAQYEGRPWWTEQRSSTYGTMLLSPNPQTLSRPEDTDFRSVSVFQKPRGEQEIRELHDDILSSLGHSTAHQAIKLYCCARYRSRVSLEEWTTLEQKENLVERALTSRPLPEISTLAWLCRGEVGLQEVKSLPRTFRTWNAILDPKILNESQRLERFLLLLQSGAEIQEVLPLSLTWTDQKKRSILFEYIRACRRAVVGMVMKEIISQFHSVRNEPQISEATRAYLTGRGCHYSSTALSHFVDAVNYEAVLELHSEVEPLLLETVKDSGLSVPLHVHENDQNYRLEHRRDAQQIVHLLHRTKLQGSKQGKSQSSSYPLDRIAGDVEQGNLDRGAQEDGSVVAGWEVVKINSNNGKLVVYRDLVTQSITLRKPCVNFLTGSQVRIGYQDDREESFYLPDISFFFRSNFNTEAFKQRFPIYSKEWFMGEQNAKASTEDVLGALANRWRIPSLTETVDITWLSYFLSMWQKVFSISLITLFLYGLRLIPLVALLAHGAK